MKPFISNENYLLCEGSLITESTWVLQRKIGTEFNKTWKCVLDKFCLPQEKTPQSKADWGG
jgi:hypothetical protein